MNNMGLNFWSTDFFQYSTVELEMYFLLWLS